MIAKYSDQLLVSQNRESVPERNVGDIVMWVKAGAAVVVVAAVLV